MWTSHYSLFFEGDSDEESHSTSKLNYSTIREEPLIKQPARSGNEDFDVWNRIAISYEQNNLVLADVIDYVASQN